MSDMTVGQSDVPASDVSLAPLFAALAEARLEFDDIVKDKSATIQSDKGKYGYKFADLADVNLATAKQLAKHGLHVFQEPDIEFLQNGKLVVWVHGHITHKSGGVWHMRPFPMPVTNGVGPQAIGSAFSYGRRYQIMGALNIAAKDEDDDGQAAGGKGEQKFSGRPSLSADEVFDSPREAGEKMRQQRAQEARQQAAPAAVAAVAGAPAEVSSMTVVAAKEDMRNDPESSGSDPHQACWMRGLTTFGPDWKKGARPWLVGKWTKMMGTGERTSFAELSDDEKDVLAAYIRDNATKLQEIWAKQGPKYKAAMAQSSAPEPEQAAAAFN
jgi:hypothetical protein